MNWAKAPATKRAMEATEMDFMASSRVGGDKTCGQPAENVEATVPFYVSAQISLLPVTSSQLRHPADLAGSALVQLDFGHITCYNHGGEHSGQDMSLPDRVEYDGEQEF